MKLKKSNKSQPKNDNAVVGQVSKDTMINKIHRNKKIIGIITLVVVIVASLGVFGLNKYNYLDFGADTSTRQPNQKMTEDQLTAIKNDITNSKPSENATRDEQQYYYTRLQSVLAEQNNCPEAIVAYEEIKATGAAELPYDQLEWIAGCYAAIGKNTQAKALYGEVLVILNKNLAKLTPESQQTVNAIIARINGTMESL